MECRSLNMANCSEFSACVIEWLKKNIPPFLSISYCAVYGSVARRSADPEDCDLLVVSDSDPDEIEWRKMRREMSAIRDRFSMAFGIRLSVVILTTKEWEETRDFFSDRLSVIGSA